MERGDRPGGMTIARRLAVISSANVVATPLVAVLFGSSVARAQAKLSYERPEVLKMGL
jgi:hypothetical protein